MEKPEWLSYKDIGYIIHDNHTDGVFRYHVIYPNREDYKGTFCLYDTPMTEEETMLDIIPNWKEQLRCEREYGEEKIPFEDMYNEMYTKIDNIFYKNISFYKGIILYNNDIKYEPYNIWFCKEKKSFKKLWDIIKKKQLKKVQKQFELK